MPHRLAGTDAEQKVTRTEISNSRCDEGAQEFLHATMGSKGVTPPGQRTKGNTIGIVYTRGHRPGSKSGRHFSL